MAKIVTFLIENIEIPNSRSGLHKPMIKWEVGRQTCRRGPHLGIESAQGSREAHISDGADEGAAASAAGNREVMEVGVFGAIEPLELV